MPKKTKNHSNKQASYAREARARAARREQQIDAVIKATREAFPTALEAGGFTVMTEDGALKVTLEEMQERINADLANEDEPALDGPEELTKMLTEEVAEGHVVFLQNGLWHFPEAYLPKGWQA